MNNGNVTLATVATAICLLGGFSATAQNLITNGDFGSGDLTGWTIQPGGVDQTTITYDNAVGNPPGSALLDRVVSTLVDNSDYLYQVVPVSVGKSYQFNADWKGDLYNGGDGRNWAEIMIAFVSDPGAPSFQIMYKKASLGGPNEPPLTGWDWESVLLSPNGGPTNGIFTATDNYMVVCFNLGGRAASDGNTAPGYYYVDNVSVTPYPPVSQPVFTNLTRAGADIILQGSNGPPTGVYEVLRSPDATGPLEGWLDIGTNTFDPSGDFSFTNALPADAVSFYRLLVVSVVSAPEITMQPQDRAAVVGQTVDFSVSVEGASPLHYQWYYNTNALLAGETNMTLTLNDVQLTNAGMYSVTITNVFGSTNSVFAELTVTTNVDPVGFATVAGGITGGAGGLTQTVSTASAFTSAVGANDPRVVFVDGLIDLSGGLGSVNIHSDKTIIGVGGNAQISGQLQISGQQNVIVQNLSISNNGTVGGLDGVRIVSGSHHIWVDHCTFVDCSDGEVDITVASDYVTVSWCKFMYVNQVDHNFVNLIAASDTDAGNYRITFHHNWWSTGCSARMPMSRYGTVHLFNNYYHAPGNQYCSNARTNAQFLSENNYYQQVRSPIYKESNGRIRTEGNIYEYCTGTAPDPGTDTLDAVLTPPPYPYTLDPTVEVPSIVTNNAGSGKLP